MRLYLRCLSYFRDDWKLALGVMLLMLASTVSGLAMAWPLAILVDSVLMEQPREDWIHRSFLALLPEERTQQILALALLGFALKLLQDVLGMWRTMLSNRINYAGLLRVRSDLFRKLQGLSIAYHRAQPLGDAVYRLSQDTFGAQSVLGVFMSLTVSVVTLSLMLLVLLSRSVSLTLLALSVTPLLVGANIRFGRTLKRRSLVAKEIDGRFLTLTQRSMSTIGLVQAYGREAEDLARFHDSVRNSIRAWLALAREEVRYWLIVGSTFGLGTALIFGYGGWLVHQNLFVDPDPQGFSVGDLTVFLAYLGMLWDPLCKLTGAGASAQAGAAGAARVFEVLDRDPQIIDAPDALELPLQPRRIELSDVHFGYQPGHEILHGLDVRIDPGQMVAFVGPSGVGKSTLLNLLPRFYDPTAGAILFDGLDARRLRIADLRRHIALVLQDSIILPTSIAENIGYGTRTATDDDIRRAARLAGASEFIEALPHGYETQIAEGGSNLSGGQRQRISIARAILSQAPVIVFDEPTSSLDPHHERLVTETMLALKGTRTLIVVTHRLQTVLHADCIHVMEAGRIVERGTHEELMRLAGRYRRSF